MQIYQLSKEPAAYTYVDNVFSLGFPSRLNVTAHKREELVGRLGALEKLLGLVSSPKKHRSSVEPSHRLLETKTQRVDLMFALCRTQMALALECQESTSQFLYHQSYLAFENSGSEGHRVWAPKMDLWKSSNKNRAQINFRVDT